MLVASKVEQSYRMLRAWLGKHDERGSSDRAVAFLRALTEAATAAGSATTEREVYDRAIDTLQELHIRPGLLLVGSDGLLRIRRVGVEEDLTSKAWQLVGRSPDSFSIAPEVSPEFARVLGERRTIYLDDIIGLAATVLPGVPRVVVRAAMRLLGFTSIILSPVVAEDEVVGILAVHHRGMEPHDVDVAALFARQIGDAVGRVRMIESLRAKNETIQQAQQRAMAAQRLEAMGKLAGGIAHDFNNLLTVIMTTASEVEAALPPDSGDMRDELEVLFNATEKAASLTKQLLDFAREGSASPKVFDLRPRLRNLEGILRRSLGTHVRMHVEVGPEPAEIYADPSQFDQVVMNLAFNARDAMPEGGELGIQAETTDDEVRLVVRDEGVGMDAETMTRVFEPFFSTKARDEGTGLGMATCFGIVTGVGGTIDVESEPGRGTTVRVSFPRSRP